MRWVRLGEGGVEAVVGWDADGCGISEVGLVSFQGGVTMFSGWGWRPDQQLEANK